MRLGLLLAVLAGAWVVVSAQGQVDDFADLPAAPAPPSEIAGSDSAPSDRVADRSGAGQRVSRSGQRDEQAVALVGDVVLSAPSERLVRTGFLEARSGTALAMTPLGTLGDNDNPSKFAPGDDVAGPEYYVLGSRGEPWPATSSLAVVLPADAGVRAPVDGRVTEVARYPLADGRVDVRVRIVPDSSTEMAVELRHLSDVGVSTGERVRAGETELGTVREVQVAHPAHAITEEGQAHLRVEVRPAREAAPPDPNAPAEAAAYG